MLTDFSLITDNFLAFFAESHEIRAANATNGHHYCDEVWKLRNNSRSLAKMGKGSVSHQRMI